MATVEQHVITDALAATESYGSSLRTIRSKEEKDMVHRYTIEQAFKGGFYGTLLGVGIHLALTRVSPRYAGFHHTPKWIFILAWPISGFTLMGEHSALELERKIAARKSMVDINSLATPAAQTDPQALDKFSWVPSPEDVKKYILDNRYKVVGISWLTITSLTLATLWANKNMPVAQKLIHARMYAQGTALASFIAFAFAANTPMDRSSEMDKLSQRYFESILQGRDVSGEGYERKQHAPAVHHVRTIQEGGVMVRGG